MKQANNNEMDILLRSLARGRNPSQLRGESVSSEVVSDHLDADELNSYAEGVAPDAARLRYMEHIADCEACRSLVVGLTQTSGAANRYDVQGQKSGSSWRQTLAALFSPAVLRFAVPALVLTIVIGIGFVARQTELRTSPIAQNPANESRSAETAKVVDKLAPSTAATPPSGLQPDTRSGTLSGAAGEKGSTEDKRAPTVATELPDARPTAGKDLAQPEEEADAARRQPYAPEPKAAAPAPPTVLLDRAEKPADLAKEQAAKREDQDRSRDAFRTQTDDVHGPNRGRSNTQQMPATGSVAGGVMSSRGDSGPNKSKVAEKKVGADDTRTISGRRFTREGSSWVDTDYDSSRTTIKVTRGSDQFRALVADEPGIRNIADQLNGVVIVVWKNRAYRIQ